MSPLFLKAYRRENRCPQCRVLGGHGKVPGKSLCAEHLRNAAERFRCWSEQRRAIGRCVLCNKRSVTGELKCRVHKEINRVRCLEWTHQHPEHSKKVWEERKQMIAQGFCPLCRDHRPLTGGYHSCEVCRWRRRVINQLRARP